MMIKACYFFSSTTKEVKLMREKILNATQEALQGSHKIKITIRKDSANKIFCLTKTSLSGVTSLNGKRLILMLAEQTGSWENDLDREIIATLAKDFDHHRFAEQMHDTLEKIEVVVT
jgi:hypothetical protein